MKNHINKLVIISNMFIFVFLFVFFFYISPLVLYDADDWKYLGLFRLPIPIWGGWNPTRVLGESLMPVCGWIGAHLYYPVIGNYSVSITAVSATVISLFIVVMLISFCGMVQKWTGCSSCYAVLYEILFLSMFFLIFRNRANSRYMFYASDLTCVYFYTIAGITNAILLIVLMKNEDINISFFEFSFVEKTLFVLLTYFALFSNLFHSAITACWCGAAAFMALIKNRKGLKNYVRNNTVTLTIVLVWFVVLLFEKSGGRAGVFDKALDIEMAVTQMKVMIFAISKPFTAIVLVSVFFAITLFIRKKEVRIQLIKYSISFILLVVFLILLNAKVGYMSRIEASWGIWFYLILFCAETISKALHDSNYSKLLPIFIVIMIVLCIHPDGKYQISSDRNSDYELCLKANNYFVDKIVEADKNNELDYELHIPEIESQDNFTFIPGIGNLVSKALYNSGIIENEVFVTEIFDSSLNEDFLLID